MTFANYFDAYPLVYYYFSFYLSFFFRPSEVGVGREVDRACSPPPPVEKRAGSVREAEAQEALL